MTVQLVKYIDNVDNDESDPLFEILYNYFYNDENEDKTPAASLGILTI